MEPILSVNQIKKTFRLSKKQQAIQKTQKAEIIAVDHLSFNVYPGQIYGLLGPNGAGKTTALRIISTLIKADEGDALLLNHSIKDDPEFVRRHIGFLTSELRLEDFFTPNYLFDFFARLHDVKPEVIAERKKVMFEKFGIDTFAEVKVANLSTGMKQKVSLVISLVHDPDFIVFDEPTNGLDVLTAKIVTDFLLDLQKRGKTIIISTHIFSLVEKICTHVGIIISGKMICDGSLQEVCQGQSLEERFFTLYQQEVGEVA